MVLVRGPKTQAVPWRGASGATRALIGGGAADFFDQQRVDAAIGIITGNSRKTAVDHETHTVDGERRLGHISRDHYFAPFVTCYCGVLIFCCELAMEREDGEFGAESVGGFAHGAGDLVGPRHKDENVAFGTFRKYAAELFDRKGPDGSFTSGRGKVFDAHGVSASFRRQSGAGLQICFHGGNVQSRRHYNDDKIGPRSLLNFKGACQRDVTIEMALVKFVEDDRTHPTQARVG